MGNDDPKTEWVTSQSQEKGIILDFLDWCGQKGIFLGHHVRPEGYTQDVFMILSQSKEDLVYEYFDIDPVELESELRRLLGEIKPKGEE